MAYIGYVLPLEENIFKQHFGSEIMQDIDEKKYLLQNYRRVRWEEYASAAVFGLGMIVFGYETFEGLRNDKNTFSTLLCCYIAVGCGSLASSSFEQGRVMSAKVSELERELQKSSRKF